VFTAFNIVIHWFTKLLGNEKILVLKASCSLNARKRTQKLHTVVSEALSYMVNPLYLKETNLKDGLVS